MPNSKSSILNHFLSIKPCAAVMAVAKRLAQQLSAQKTFTYNGFHSKLDVVSASVRGGHRKLG